MTSNDVSKYKVFKFVSWNFDSTSHELIFRYAFDDSLFFSETVTFPGASIDLEKNSVLREACILSFILSGISYYKLFPGASIDLGDIELHEFQARFFNITYLHGLSQFLFENKLSTDVIPTFPSKNSAEKLVEKSDGDGVLLLQSGGKDSLLLASILQDKDITFTPWYVSTADTHPEVIDNFSTSARIVRRKIDHENLRIGQQEGGRNGHVPVTYIVMSYALIDAILLGKRSVLTSIGWEGDEPHEFIGQLAVNHQWSKTWEAEQLFVEYVQSAVSKDMQIGSPLRSYSELLIAEQFVEKAWRYARSFSSCNRANYMQGHDNKKLTWCGECPKCANSYLLFAPFVDPQELQEIFGGNLLVKPELGEVYKGLLGIDGVMKPFECVGETKELRLAYHLAKKRWGAIYSIGFEVPESDFDYKKTYPCQDWAKKYSNRF